MIMLSLPPQPPLGDGDEGGHAEVPEPHEPRRGGRGRAGPRCGHQIGRAHV